MTKITKIEDGTAKNGNPLKKVYLSEKVNNRDMVFLFSDHTRYNDLTVGMELGPDEIVADGQYIKLVDPDAGIKGKGGGSRSGMIKQAMNEKNEMIARAQDNKGEAIKLASTIRMAVDMVTAYKELYGVASVEDLKDEIEKWRSYFYTTWEDISQDEPPFRS